MSGSHTALLSVKTYSNRGLFALREAVQLLNKTMVIQKISSVYKVDRKAESLEGLRDIRKEERFEGLAVVVLVQTKESAENLFAILSEAEQQIQKEVLRRSVSMNLLTYDEDIIMLPHLAVPHPELHNRPEELVLATEVYSDYVHPVMNKSLQELAWNFRGSDWGEFFLQGSALLEA